MKTSLRIFIAEDEAIILSSFRAAIEHMGHSVAGFALDGETAQKMIKEISPDLVLIDINLPKKTGIEVIRAVNQDTLIPCIVITGYYSDMLIEDAAKAGALGYLLKPVDLKQLEAAIRIAQARYQEFQELYKESSSLKNALEVRKYVEKAKGILMRRGGLQEEEAMKALQKKSKDTNKKLIVIAKEIIAADKLLDI